LNFIKHALSTLEAIAKFTHKTSILQNSIRKIQLLDFYCCLPFKRV
jgi:hypothetical protein